jgi:hypothetical protein
LASQCLPGGLFLFCNLCWGFTRQLIPRFLVVRIVVDPVKQLFTARLLVLGPWGFLFAEHWVSVSESGRPEKWPEKPRPGDPIRLL